MTGETIRVSVDSQGGEGRGSVSDVESTADGQTVIFVADERTFETRAVDDASSGRLYVRDLRMGTTRKLALSPVWRDPPNAAVIAGRITPDGQTIFVRAFGGSDRSGWDLHDLARGVVVPSVAFYPVGSVTPFFNATLSDDGQLLAYITQPSMLQILDRRTGLIEDVPVEGVTSRLTLGPGGKRLVFSSSRNDPKEPYDPTDVGGSVYLLDRDPDNDGIPTYWENTFGLDPNTAADAAGDLDGDGATALQEFQAASNPVATTTRYFAEGAANGFFSSRVAVLNPGDATNAVTVRMFGADGQSTSQTQVVGARARATFELGNGPDKAFAIVVEGQRPFVADRSMSWDANGYGSSLETAVTTPGTTWHFAEGATGGAFSLYYLLANPGAVDAQATVTYLRPAPLAPIVKTYTVAAHSRRTIDVAGEDAGLAAAEVSATITADRPIVAERAMYHSTADQPMAAGHAGAGLAAPATRWFLAEGATGFFDEFVLIANPGGTDAQLTVKYLLEDGTTVSEPITVAKQSRYTVEVRTRDPRLAATPVSIIVESTNAVPVVVERVMWWPRGQWYEASLSAGVTGTGTKWAIAEGEQGGATQQQTYALIANTGAVDTQATVIVLYEDGTAAESREVPLKANSRTSVDLGTFLRTAGKRFGLIVESAGGAPIVVERSLYASPDGRAGSAGATSVATDISTWP